MSIRGFRTLSQSVSTWLSEKPGVNKNNACRLKVISVVTTAIP